jgi:DNA-binding NtrC family response regulator
MKSILFIDRDTRLARAVRNLAEVLEIPVDCTDRTNEARRVFSSGKVGLIIANTELTTIRFQELLHDFEAIRRRNRSAVVPIYYIYVDPLQNVENLPDELPPEFLINRKTSLEKIYQLMESHVIQAEEEGESGFARLTNLHTQFIEEYGAWLKQFRRVVLGAGDSSG